MSDAVHVLMVEDSDKDAALIARELRKAGISAVTQRVDRPEALERALDEQRWDVVLADHEMPSFDAFAALAIVRRRDPDVSFVIVSGTIGEALAVKAMRAGAQDYVLKDRLTRLGPVVKREILETAIRRERSQALEALRDSEARKSAMLEAALDAVITMDHRGRVVELNASAERMFGFAKEEMLGKDLVELIVPPEVRRAKRVSAARWLSDGPGSVVGRRVEVPVLGRDGSRFPAELAIVRIARPGPPMFTGFIRDVTDRKRLEIRQRLLAEAGAKLVHSLDGASMLQAVAELVVRHAADACVVELVDENGEVRRYAAARKQRSASDPAKVLPSDRTEDAKPRTGWTKDGWAYLVVALEGRGTMLGKLWLLQAPASDGYGPLDAELAEELAARCAAAVENARLFEQVRESVQVRDDFIAIAAHELRTPLTPLLLVADALVSKLERGRLDDLAPERLARPLHQILRSTERLAELVERLLDFSELTVGRVSFTFAQHDLRTLSREVAEELQESLEDAGSRVRWRTPDHPVMGWWDAERIKLAIRNLLGNAIKFGPGRPIELSIATENGQALLSVRDHGRGFAANDQERMFKRYARPAPLRHYGGFGLGLWIVRRVAEEHGGSVEAYNHPGDGAELTIMLPFRPPRHHDVEQPEQALRQART